jgi:L-amino acid N-acyltransferase YncA
MARTDFSIRPMRESDWDSIRAIYIQGIATGNATFAATPPEWQDWDETHLRSCRLVAESDSSVIGWAALSPYSRREVYSGVAEVSVYVAESARGQGAGAALLSALAKASEEEGFWTLQAGIFPENEASIRLHRRCGFRIIGTRERIGQMNGCWRDVVLMERRKI